MVDVFLQKEVYGNVWCWHFSIKVSEERDQVSLLFYDELRIFFSQMVSNSNRRRIIKKPTRKVTLYTKLYNILSKKFNTVYHSVNTFLKKKIQPNIVQKKQKRIQFKQKSQDEIKIDDLELKVNSLLKNTLLQYGGMNDVTLTPRYTVYKESPLLDRMGDATLHPTPTAMHKSDLLIPTPPPQPVETSPARSMLKKSPLKKAKIVNSTKMNDLLKEMKSHKLKKTPKKVKNQSPKHWFEEKLHEKFKNATCDTDVDVKSGEDMDFWE
jgi:hypothetical protein